MIGVYKITNTVDGKVYIGSTAVGMKARWSNHLSSLRKGTHYNRRLQNAWSKYGENAFTFEIVETAVDSKDARVKEASWISKVFGKNCYNSSMEGSGRPTIASRQAICECVEKAIEEGVSNTNKMQAYVRKHLGDGIRKDAIADVMHELGYELIPVWEKRGK